MEGAILVHFLVPFMRNGMERREQARIYRKLYGYKSSSNYRKYHYDVKVLLDSIPSVRYEGGNFLIREKDLPLIKKFIEENRSRYRAWRVIPDEEESTILKLHAP
ncbi:MAG: hypothetical protein QXQ46_11865 [Thermoplasmatales archaeon]